MKGVIMIYLSKRRTIMKNESSDGNKRSAAYLVTDYFCVIKYVLIQLVLHLG